MFNSNSNQWASAEAQQNQLNLNNNIANGSANEHPSSNIGGTGWDAEDEHFLSYFLSNEQCDSANGGPNGPVNMHEQKDDLMPPPPARTHFSVPTTVPHSQPNSEPMKRKGIEPPATPAIQFYASNIHQGQPVVTQTTSNNSQTPQVHHFQHSQVTQPQTQQFTNVFSQPMASAISANPAGSSSSSSSSLSSQAAPLLQSNPAHVMQVHQQFKTTSVPVSDNFTNMSPISPAAMIGAGGEMMLLPMPQIFQNTNNNKTTVDARAPTMQPIQQPLETSYQMSHAEWLQQMNQIASSASLAPNASNVDSSPAPLAAVPVPAQQLSTNSHPYQNVIQSQINVQGIQNQNIHPQQQHVQPHPQHQQIMAPMAVPGTLCNNTDILPSVPTTTTTTSASSNLNRGMIMTHFKHQPSAKETTQDHVAESKEKRERRLARNRESARQSRRRKKDLLLNLGHQVNQLHTGIETERRRQLVVMEKELDEDRKRRIEDLKVKMTSDEGSTNATTFKSDLEPIVQNGGPNCPARRAAAVHQYNMLKQLMLPVYKQYFLWLTLQEESFLTDPKEKKSKLVKGTGRISSKQVGEDVSNAQKNAGENGTKSYVSCNSNDGDKSWPLICYELGISLDQEEKLLNAFRRVKKESIMPESRPHAATSATMVNNLKNGVLFQSHSAAHRNEASLLQVLTPEQSARFLNWFNTNKERCKKAFGVKMLMKDLEAESHLNNVGTNSSAEFGQNDRSLNDVCRQLTEALKIAERE